MGIIRTTGKSARALVRGAALAFLLPMTLQAQEPAVEQPALHAPAPVEAPPVAFKRFQADYELDAYYSNVSLAIALTEAPIPQLGEMSEEEIYRKLLQWALVPRFLYLEASFNPMPYLGVYIKRNQRDFYDDARVSGGLNLIKSLTAGFEEPWAASIFAGTVVDFNVPGKTDTAGKGYSGYLLSAGNYHIKDNTLIKDDWLEAEWKVKGDRKSPVKKLNWSFRVGAKLHNNPDITDIIYLSFRRSRVDYKPARDLILNNSGFEYTYDMSGSGLRPMRHYFFVDKKWPSGEGKWAFALALGFVWESKNKYTGQLAADRTKDEFQFILRPNIEF